jgi:hypothetical protein
VEHDDARRRALAAFGAGRPRPDSR